MPRRIPALLASLLLSPIAVSAQVVGATITGLVQDSSGAVVPNASVLIRNQETGLRRQLLSDSSGAFAAPSIPVGLYTVQATLSGFAPQSRTNLVLTVGQSLRVDLTLHPAGEAQQVSVTDAAPPLNLSTQQTAGLVDERQVRDLPLNGRSYDQLLTLNPATVNYTAQRSGSIGTSNSSVGNMFSVAGRRPQDNLYLLNGVEYTGASLINVTPGGTSGQLLGIEAVREFNVVSGTYAATYGKRQGAQVSIVTASGTNTLHGAAYEFLRNSFFDARNYFDQARIPNFQRNNFGAALGGALRPDRLFLFANYESYRQNLGITNVTLVPDANARQGLLPDSSGALHPVPVSSTSRALLALWPVANGPELLSTAGLPTGIARAYSSPTQHIREDFGTARFDANLSPRDLLFAVYTVDDSTAHTPTQNPLSLIDESLREQVASVQYQRVITSRLLNTARAGYSRAAFYFLGSIPADIQTSAPTFLPGRPTGAIVIAGSTASNGSSQITGAGANVGSNNAIARNLYTLDDHVFFSRGHHQLEAGVWLQRLDSNDNLAQNQYGQASFADLPGFLAGTIKTFTVVPSPTPLNWRSTMGAAYVEETWQALPSLELRAGLRVESTNGWNELHGHASRYVFTNGVIATNPTTGSAGLLVNRARFLPEPRLGLAYNLLGRSTTILHAGIGLHASLLDNLDYRFDQAAPFNTTLSYANASISAPTSGAAGLISPSTVQTDIATPRTLVYTLSVEQQLPLAATLTVGYSGSHSTSQLLSEDDNQPASILRNGRYFYPTTVKANPALANTTSWVSAGMANYNALTADLQRRFTRGLQLRANYTYSKNLDNGSAMNTSVSANTPAFVSYPANRSLDYGPAATDVRHIASLSATFELPFGAGHRFFGTAPAFAQRAVGGWSLSTLATLQSGFPFSPQLGYNPTGSGDTRNPVRPDVNPAFTGALIPGGTTAQRAARYFAPTAFSAPPYGTVGNLGRDTLTGPGFADWDLSLLKTTALSDRTRLQFRAEFFNVLNHTSLLTPNAVVFSAGPTQGSSSAQNTTPVASPTAGVITAAATSRQIQLALKLLF